MSTINPTTINSAALMNMVEEQSFDAAKENKKAAKQRRKNAMGKVRAATVNKIEMRNQAAEEELKGAKKANGFKLGAGILGTIAAAALAVGAVALTAVTFGAGLAIIGAAVAIGVAAAGSGFLAGSAKNKAQGKADVARHQADQSELQADTMEEYADDAKDSIDNEDDRMNQLLEQMRARDEKRSQLLKNN